MAIIDAKGLIDAFVDEKSASDEIRRQASNIIVSTLGDQALRVVRSVIAKPSVMLSKLDKRYDSKTTASRILRMTELVSMRYTNIRDDMSVHIDKMAGLVEQLRSMGTTMDDTLAIGILVSSIEVTELLAVTASIKTLAESDINWEAVSSRFIEEVHTLYEPNGHSVRANSAETSVENSCGICGKKSHKTSSCFLNLMSPNCRIKVTREEVNKILDGGSACGRGQKKKVDNSRGSRTNCLSWLR